MLNKLEKIDRTFGRWTDGERCSKAWAKRYRETERERAIIKDRTKRIRFFLLRNETEDRTIAKPIQLVNDQLIDLINGPSILMSYFGICLSKRPCKMVGQWQYNTIRLQFSCTVTGGLVNIETTLWVCFKNKCNSWQFWVGHFEVGSFIVSKSSRSNTKKKKKREKKKHNNSGNIACGLTK